MDKSWFSQASELYLPRRSLAVLTETVGYLHCLPFGNSSEGARGDILFFFTVSVGYLQPFGECGREHRSTIAPPGTRDHFSRQKTVLTGLQTRGTATESQSSRRHISARPAGHARLRPGGRALRLGVACFFRLRAFCFTSRLTGRATFSW